MKESKLICQTVNKTAKRMVALANKTKKPVKVEFNNIELTANPGDKPDSIVRYYIIEWNRLYEECVNSPEYKEGQRKAEEAQRNRDLMLKNALAAAPEKMTYSNEEYWNKKVAANALEPYGSEIFRFAEQWARLMEGRIANGDTLEACAGETFHLILMTIENLTGFAYGRIVSILSQTWIHGEQLRCWYNLEIQMKNEGEKANKNSGVLNPALLLPNSK